MSVVENVYLEARDNIAAGISTAISWGKSLFSDSPMQEGKMTYSNGEASMTMTNVPKGGELGAMANAGLNVVGSLPGGGPTGGLMAKAPGVLNSVVGAVKKGAVSLEKQAQTISKELNGGKNSVTLGTTDKQIRYDLAGKSHGGVPTPHKQVYNKNKVNGTVKSVTRASKEAQPMTQQEVRSIRKWLEKQK